MKPVNLLPPEHRPRGASGGAAPAGGGASVYALLGTLAVVLVAALAYVHTQNSVTEKRDETARLKADTVRLEARAAELGSFANFAGVKEARLDAVRQIAVRRLDWERLVRETSLVLPSGVWLTDFEATTARPTGDASSAASPAAAPAGAAGVPTGPNVKLIGCARSQVAVATALVRLRRVHREQDVTLVRTERVDSEAQGGGGADGDSAQQGCGTTRGKGNLEWEASVSLAQAPFESRAELSKVPVSLGGGS